VLTSVVGEALMVGLFASALGVLGGVGVGAGLKALFSALGFDLPATGLVISGATIVAGMVTGTVVTLLAAIIPAIRASRVPPIAALRDVAVERTAASKGRVITGGVITAFGVLNIVNGVAGSGSGGAVGLGVVGVLVGTVVLGPVVAKPASRVIGVAAPTVKGVTGSIARENAMRNPRRTAATANALLIGVGIVSLITVLYGSLRTSIDNQISEAFTGDVTITAGGFGRGGVSPTLAQTLNQLPEVDAAAAMRDPAHVTPVALFEPGPRESVGGAAATHGHVVASVYQNVKGRVMVFSRAANGAWTGRSSRRTTGCASTGSRCAARPRHRSIFAPCAAPWPRPTR